MTKRKTKKKKPIEVKPTLDVSLWLSSGKVFVSEEVWCELKPWLDMNYFFSPSEYPNTYGITDPVELGYCQKSLRRCYGKDFKAHISMNW